MNQTTEAVRSACNFLATETPNSQLDVYKERTQQIRDALSRFMDTFYSYLSALMDKMVDTVRPYLLNIAFFLEKSSSVRQLWNNAETLCRLSSIPDL